MEILQLIWNAVANPLIFFDTPKETINMTFAAIIIVACGLGILVGVIVTIIDYREYIVNYIDSKGKYNQGSESHKLWTLALEIIGRIPPLIFIALITAIGFFIALTILISFGYLILIPVGLVGSLVAIAFALKHRTNILFSLKIKLKKP